MEEGDLRYSKRKEGKHADGDWTIGDRIEGRWEIHKILGGKGKSGMAVVYVVYDHK